jgi:hypothetical protein
MSKPKNINLDTFRVLSFDLSASSEIPGELWFKNIKEEIIGAEAITVYKKM